MHKSPPGNDLITQTDGGKIRKVFTMQGHNDKGQRIISSTLSPCALRYIKGIQQLNNPELKHTPPSNFCFLIGCIRNRFIKLLRHIFLFFTKEDHLHIHSEKEEQECSLFKRAQ